MYFRSGAYSLFTTLFLLLVLALFSQTVQAVMTPAGVVITNRAEISWFDTADGQVKKLYSNVAEITVAKLYELDLEKDIVRYAQPGQPINLPHRLMNTGNTATAYELQISDVSSDFGRLKNLKVVVDTNGNGSAGPGEQEIKAKPCFEPKEGVVCYPLDTLQYGEITQFVISGQVPVTALTGQKYTHTLKAVAIEDRTKTDSNRDKVDLIEGANLLINSTVSPPCGRPVASSDKIGFTISFTNTGTKAPGSRTFSINGSDLQGALLENVLPGNLKLLKDNPPKGAPVQSIVVVQLKLDEGSNRWVSYDKWDGTSTVSKLGLYIPTSKIQPHQSGKLEFVLVADKHLTSHTVFSEASFDISGNGVSRFVGNQVCTTLAPSPEVKDPLANNPNGSDGKITNNTKNNEAEIRFLTPRLDIKRSLSIPGFASDSDFEDAPYYRLDNGLTGLGNSDSAYNPIRDGVYIEVHSSGLNANESTIEIHTVKLASATGDILFVTVRETAPNSGIFRAIRPVRLSSSLRGAGGQCPSSATEANYTVEEPECVLNSKEDGSLRASIKDPGVGEILVDSALIDPLGIVFDSAYGYPVQGAIVTIHNDDGTMAEDPLTGKPYPPQTTQADGKYQFPLLYPEDSAHTGRYYIQVKPPVKYQFPSEMPAITLVGNTGRHVNGYSYGKDGQDGIVDSGIFTLLTSSKDMVADIPLDPDVTGVLTVIKSAASSQVSIGGMMTYTLKIHNKSHLRNNFDDSNTFDPKLYHVRLHDTLPYGFRYVSGTAFLDGKKIADPDGTPGPELTFSIYTQKSDLSLDNEEHTLTYRLRATAGAIDGDGINKAVVTSRTIDSFPVTSNQTSAQVKINQDGVLDSKGVAFGKVYVDANCDGIQNGGEWPVGGVKLYLEDGTWVITDGNGQYSLYGIKPGSHVIKVDPVTLPDGISLKPTDNRHMGDPNSRLIDLTTGEFHRADFVASCPKEEAEYVFEQIQARNAGSNDWMLQHAEQYDPNKSYSASDLNRKTGADGDISNGTVGFSQPANRAKLSDSELRVNRGYSLMLARYRSKMAAAQGINLLPVSVRAEAFMYPMGDFQTVRVGFSLNRKDLLAKKEELDKINLKSSLVTTIYERLPLAVIDRLESTNEVQRMPVPQQAIKQVTKAQAKSGTWLWPQSEMSLDGRFMAVIRRGVTPTLMVNGKAVPASQIGERIENKQEKAQIVAWYGVSLDEGENTVEVVAKDPFGNQRTLATGVFKRPAKAVKISIEPVSGELPADGGRSYLPVTIKLLDENGYPARGVNFVTLETSDGSWVERDIQDQTPGRQIRVVNGERVVHLRSSEYTGEIRIRASEGDLKAEKKIVQTVALRPLLAAGVIEINASRNTFDDLSNTPENQGDETEVHSRGAIFMKGRIRGDAHLTLSYDSAKDSRGDRFRDINPNASYPLFGDDSQRGYEAQSRSKLYAKIEKGRNSVMWGDYLTDANSNRDDVARVQRSLTGGNAVLDDGKTRLQVYAAEVQDNHILEEIRGQGIALNYHTDKKPIIRNSEVVEIVTYSRDNPGVSLSTRRLTRFGDYTLDAISGELSFADAVPAYDDQQNPVYIRISYDVDKEGKDYLVGGVRLNHQLTDELNVGISHSRDQHERDGKSITGLSAEYKTGGMAITGSVANLKHEDGSKEDGNAVRLSADKKWNEKAETRLTYGRAEKGFDNQSGGISADREEFRLTHRQRVTDDVTVNVEALHSKELESHATQQSVGVTADVRTGMWTLKGGVRHIEQKNSADSDKFNTVIVGARRPIDIANRKGNVSAEYEQDIGQASRKRISLGGDLQVHEKVKIYARAERINSLTGVSGLSVDQTQDTVAIGVKSEVMESTEIYSEYRLRGAIDGRDMETASGIRGTYEIEKGLSVSPRLEVVNSIKGNGKDSVAVSLGAKDVRNANNRKSGRIELRHDDDRDYFGAEAAYVGRLDEEWSLLARDSIRVESPDAGDTSLTNTFTVGFSRRPRKDNKHNMLFYYQNKLVEGRAGEADCNTNIVSTHQNYLIDEELTISGRLGGKVERCKQGGVTTNSDAVVLDGRMIWDINSRFDADVHGGILATDVLSEQQYAAGVGINFLVKKNLRVGGGYNIKGFKEEDLDSEGYNKQGTYIGLQYKVDENSLNWLSGEEEKDSYQAEQENRDLFDTGKENEERANQKSLFGKVKGWFTRDDD